MPEKTEEMKNILLKLWDDIEAEGPSEWWKNEPIKRPRTTKGRKLAAGKDETGTWDVVKGGTVADNDSGQSEPQPDPGTIVTGDTVHAAMRHPCPRMYRGAA